MTYDLVCESFSSIDGMPFSILVSNSKDSVYKWDWYENTTVEYNMNQMPEIMMDELDWEQTTMKRSFYENMKTYCQQYDDTCQEYLKGLELVTIEDYEKRMVFVALYINTENELCTVLKDSIYIIYGKNKEQMHSFYDVMKFIADDFVKLIEVNKKQMQLDQHEVDSIDDYCNCSHAFINELKRLGFNVNYEKGE